MYKLNGLINFKKVTSLYKVLIFEDAFNLLLVCLLALIAVILLSLRMFSNLFSNYFFVCLHACFLHALINGSNLMTTICVEAGFCPIVKPTHQA